jgi:transposase
VDRKKETLVAHFQSLGESFCQQITDVSCDIWSPYITTIETCFPNANLILDRFHVTKLLNESLDKMRKQLRQAHKEEKVFKKLKWVLFKQYYKLSDAELAVLADAFQACPALQKNYFLREEFHHILENNDDVDIVLTLIDQMDRESKINTRCYF